ncbi:MAG: hypothetical protein AVDCRST_MAG16-1294, partial [uncultured Frankineae bacterium]
ARTAAALRLLHRRPAGRLLDAGRRAVGHCEAERSCDADGRRFAPSAAAGRPGRL